MVDLLTIVCVRRWSGLYFGLPLVLLLLVAKMHGWCSGVFSRLLALSSNSQCTSPVSELQTLCPEKTLPGAASRHIDALESLTDARHRY